MLGCFPSQGAMWLHVDAAEADPATGPDHHTEETALPKIDLLGLRASVYLMVHLIRHQLGTGDGSTDAIIQQLCCKGVVWEHPFLIDAPGNLVPQPLQPWQHPSEQAWAEKQAIASRACSLLHYLNNSKDNGHSNYTLCVQVYWLISSQVAGNKTCICC